MMKFASDLLLPFIAGLALVDAQLPKILGLHGGGGSASSMAVESSDLVNSLRGEFEFVFASIGSQTTNEVWWADPPSKDNPTTNPEHASAMVRELDDIIRREGPFYAIMGYSQGAAAVPVYLSNVPSGTFQTAMMFCGYLPTTHTGLVNRIQQQSPFGDISALVWMGAQDSLITNRMSYEMAAEFTNPAIVVDPNQGHVVPSRGDATYQSVINFIRGTGPVDSVDPTDPVTNPFTPGNGNGSDGDKEEVDSDWGNYGGDKEQVGGWGNYGGDKEQVGGWGNYGGDKEQVGSGWGNYGGDKVQVGGWGNNANWNKRGRVQPKSNGRFGKRSWAQYGR